MLIAQRNGYWIIKPLVFVLVSYKPHFHDAILSITTGHEIYEENEVWLPADWLTINE